MWNCHLCKTINTVEEIICVACGVTREKKEFRLITLLLNGLKLRLPPDIYHAATGDAKAEKKRFVLLLYKTARVSVLLLVFFSLGTGLLGTVVNGWSVSDRMLIYRNNFVLFFSDAYGHSYQSLYSLGLAARETAGQSFTASWGNIRGHGFGENIKANTAFAAASFKNLDGFPQREAFISLGILIRDIPEKIRFYSEGVINRIPTFVTVIRLHK